MGNLVQNKPELLEDKTVFKVGDKVEIIDEFGGHEFDVGDVVEIIGVTTEGEQFEDRYGKKYEAIGLNGIEWYIYDDEIVLREVGPNSALTKAIKETQGKVTYQDIDWDFFDAISNRMDENKDKYPIGNWKKDMDINDLLTATIRHCRKVLQPIDGDEETVQQHILSVACNAMMSYYQIKNK